MKIRQTKMQDFECVLEIYRYAREQMRANGNPNQWYDRYPEREVILHDIEGGHSYVLEKNGTICGVFAFFIGKDPTYQTIEGEWKNNAEYGTIHRIASSGKIHGVFELCLKFCESKISNLRIDTHQDNFIMRHLIEKNGFQRCGIIHVRDGSERIAYQKTINSQFSMPAR